MITCRHNSAQLIAISLLIALLGSTTTHAQSADATAAEPPLALASFCCETDPSDGESKYPIIGVTGFFQADAAGFAQDDANIVAVGDIQNGADFRRARLAAVGSVADNVDYIIEFDFGFLGRPSFMDVWLEITDLKLLQKFRVGQFRVPFGLGGLTSVRELTFIERGLPFAFLPFRQIGVMAHGQSEAEDSTWAISGFRVPTDLYGGQIGDSGGYGMATRLTKLLVDCPQRAFHVGGSYAFLDPANNSVHYLSPPEVLIAQTGAAFVPAGVLIATPAFVDTNTISTQTVNLLAAELAYTSGSFHSQAELVHSMVNRRGGSAVSFSGVTAQAAYILTGEHRPYNRSAGVLGRVAPKCPFGRGGNGAWEVAGRWSYLDLNDADIAGGRLNDLTAGVNWYLNKYTKFQFNYVHAFLNSPVNGKSNADILAMRAQVDF